MTDKSMFKIAVFGFLIITSILTVIFVLAAVFQATLGSGDGGTAGISVAVGGVSLRLVRWVFIGTAIAIILTFLIVRRRRFR